MAMQRFCSGLLYLFTAFVILINLSSSSNDQFKPVRFLVDQDATDMEVKEYVDYFARPTTSSPLKQFLHTPRTLFTLAKAAEIAVENYSENSNRIFRLRQILDLKELRKDTHYWFHVLVSEGDKFLTEASLRSKSPSIHLKRKT